MIFLFSIFEGYPNIKALFGFSTTPLAELHDSPTLQKHGVRIMQTIDYILNSIFVSCDMECTEVTGLLSELGRSHLNLKVKPEYISVSSYSRYSKSHNSEIYHKIVYWASLSQ